MSGDHLTVHKECFGCLFWPCILCCSVAFLDSRSGMFLPFVFIYYKSRGGSLLEY